MKRITETQFYKGLCVFLFLFLLFYMIASNKAYNEQLEINEQTQETMDTVFKQSDEMIRQWENDYYELMFEYMELVDSYDLLVEEKESYITKSSLVEVREYNLTQEEIYLLAQCVEAEAGTIGYTTDLEQQYICQVILNRYNSDVFPNTIKEVIYQKNKGVPQFSVAYNGMMQKHSNVEIKTLANVYSVLAKGTDMPSYVLYFYDKSVKGNYVNTLNRYITVGRTVFAYHSKDIKEE